MNVGIFGITANPPHLGHWKAINEALSNENHKLDEIWVSPVFNHPFNKKFIDYTTRLKMLSILLLEFPIKNVKIKELDKEYFNSFNEIVYSYNLLKYLKNKYDYNFSLIIGEDNYKPEVWKKFYKYKELEKEFNIITVKDNGFHSTQIRNLIYENNINPLNDYLNNSLKELVGNEVTNLILNEKLYKEV